MILRRKERLMRTINRMLSSAEEFIFSYWFPSFLMAAAFAIICTYFFLARPGNSKETESMTIALEANRDANLYESSPACAFRRQELRQAMLAYLHDTGKDCIEWDEMEEAGYMEGIDPCPSGGIYELEVGFGGRFDSQKGEIYCSVHNPKPFPVQDALVPIGGD